MRRLALTTFVFALLALTLAATAFAAHDGGQGTYGEVNDKNVTNAGYILIVAFPVLVFVLSMVQGRLDKRKQARLAAKKARATAPEWRGGW